MLAAEPFDLGVFGVAGTTIAILLYFIRILWADNKDLRHEQAETSERSLTMVTEVATTASHHLAESARAMEAATIQMHQLAARSLTVEQWYQLVTLLQEHKRPL